MTDGAPPSAPVPSRARIIAGGTTGWGGGSGPEVTRLFHRVLAAVSQVAWISLAVQIRLLVASHGLLPLADFVHAARADLETLCTRRIRTSIFPG